MCYSPPMHADVRTKALARESEPTVVVGIALGERGHAAECAPDFTINKRSVRKKVIITEILPTRRSAAPSHSLLPCSSAQRRFATEPFAPGDGFASSITGRKH